MKKVCKRLISVITSILMLLGMNGGFLNPTAAYAVDDSVNIVIDGTFNNTSYTSVYTVNGTNVTVTFDSTALDGQSIVADNSSNEAVLAALGSAITGISGFNADTMDVVIETQGSNVFSCALAFTSGSSGYVFSRADGGNDGILGTGEYHFKVIPKNQGGGGRPGGDSIAHIEMESSGLVWTGSPCVYEGFFPFIEDTDMVEWNCANMKSWQFCNVSVNGGGHRGFNNTDSRYTTTPDSSVDVDYNAGADPSKVDVTFSFNWAYRPADIININDHDYRVSDYLNFDDRQAWLDAFSFEYQDQDISLTIPDVPVIIDNHGVANISVVLNLRPVSATECFIGNFLWSSNPNPDNPDDDQYIGHADLALISATYPEWLGGRTFKEDVLESESRASKDEKTARYITYGVTNRDGEMVLPVGTKVTMRVAPEFGYQVTSFKINGTPIEQDEIDTGSDVAVFTFTIETANFHLGADILQVGNEAVTANTKAVSEAGVELGGTESSMKIGTAKLEIEDFTPSPAQEGLFRTAAGDYEVKDFIDISLFNTVYKGTSSASWDTPVKKLDNKATIYLDLEEDVSDKDVVIVHEVAEGDYETIEATYLEEIGVLAFETGSFSNYAIAVKDQGPSKDIDLSWYTSSGKSYWYENGVRQGTADDPKAVVFDGIVRGREIYDPASNEWYWLDADADGAMARNKEVFVPYVYQDEKKWDNAGKRVMSYASDHHIYDFIYDCMVNGLGKWIRYDVNGKMVRGWFTIEGDELEALYPTQVGNTYYYDTQTGAMVRGDVNIDGVKYHFDENTGVLDKTYN